MLLFMYVKLLLFMYFAILGKATSIADVIQQCIQIACSSTSFCYVMWTNHFLSMHCAQHFGRGNDTRKTALWHVSLNHVDNTSTGGNLERHWSSTVIAVVVIWGRAATCVIRRCRERAKSVSSVQLRHSQKFLRQVMHHSCFSSEHSSKILEMGKNPNPVRTNWTGTLVVPITEQNPNPNVMVLTWFFHWLKL